MDGRGGCEDFIKKVGKFWIYFNFLLCLFDRIFQIVYFVLTDFSNNDSLKQTALTFVIIKPIVNTAMSLINMFFIQEPWDWSKKIKKAIVYIIAAEFCSPFYVQYSIENKFEASDTGPKFTITNKVLNVLHMMFCSLPQILIICIYSSYLGKFVWIDILSLTLSVIFIIWSIIYYVFCITECIDLDDYYIPEE